MISELTLKNYKLFEQCKIPMSPVTLLTGPNSSGKSSIVQALLLIDSARQFGNIVPLNGPFGLSLGEANDILHAQATTAQVEIGIRVGDVVGEVGFECPDDRSLYLNKTRDTITGKALNAGGGLGEVGYFLYLNTERLGPRDLQDVSYEEEERLRVGYQGEFVAHVMNRLSRKQVERNLLHPNTSEVDGVVTLHKQVEMWMSTIAGPLQIESTWLPNTSAASLRFKSPYFDTEWLRPSNVGFGISYSLPIVVAGLTAPPGSILVIENPESHLHPAGQTALGHFMARIASIGSQVIIETHSNYILEGIRHSTRIYPVIEVDDVVAHYVRGAQEIVELDVGGSQRISGWPEGFYDRTEEEYLDLLRTQRAIDEDERVNRRLGG